MIQQSYQAVTQWCAEAWWCSGINPFVVWPRSGVQGRASRVCIQLNSKHWKTIMEACHPNQALVPQQFDPGHCTPLCLVHNDPKTQVYCPVPKNVRKEVILTCQHWRITLITLNINQSYILHFLQQMRPILNEKNCTYFIFHINYLPPYLPNALSILSSDHCAQLFSFIHIPNLISLRYPTQTDRTAVCLDYDNLPHLQPRLHNLFLETSTEPV